MKDIEPAKAMCRTVLALLEPDEQLEPHWRAYESEVNRALAGEPLSNGNGLGWLRHAVEGVEGDVTYADMLLAALKFSLTVIVMNTVNPYWKHRDDPPLFDDLKLLMDQAAMLLRLADDLEDTNPIIRLEESVYKAYAKECDDKDKQKHLRQLIAEAQRPVNQN